METTRSKGIPTSSKTTTRLEAIAPSSKDASRLDANSWLPVVQVFRLFAKGRYRTLHAEENMRGPFFRKLRQKQSNYQVVEPVGLKQVH